MKTHSHSNQVYRDIEQFIPDLTRYSRAITFTPAAAEDLVQETVTRALAKADRFKPGTNLRAWLFTIMHNQHVSTIRRESRKGVAVDPDKVPMALSRPPGQEDTLAVAALDRALKKLPGDQRRLIKLVALDGMSYEEAADHQGLPIGTVKSRISRGRRELRRTLEGRIRRGNRRTTPHSTGGRQTR